MFVFIVCVLAALTQFVCCLTGYFNTLCVLAALTWFVCCFTGYFNTLCTLCLKFNMCCFVLAHQACCVKTACRKCCPQPSSSTDLVLKQPVTKTTHIMCHEQHTGLLNLHPVMCIGVLYCPHCVTKKHEMRYKCCFNTCSSEQHTMGTLMQVISTWLFLQCVQSLFQEDISIMKLDIVKLPLDISCPSKH